MILKFQMELNKCNDQFNNEPNLQLRDNLINNNIKDIINDENLLHPNNQIDTKTKNYYPKFNLVLIIQYSLISLLVWLGFFSNWMKYLIIALIIKLKNGFLFRQY